MIDFDYRSLAQLLVRRIRHPPQERLDLNAIPPKSEYIFVRTLKLKIPYYLLLLFFSYFFIRFLFIFDALY